MKNTNFEFTEENTLLYVPCKGESHNYLDCPAHNKDFMRKYSNGVSGLCSNIYTSPTEALKGKTINYVYILSNGDLFIGFEDNTFTLLHGFDLLMYDFNGQSTKSDIKDYLFLSDIPSSYVVYDGDDLDRDYTQPDIMIVKMTPIGKWLHEHTDCDVVSYYEEVKAQRDVFNERKIKEQEEKQYKDFLYYKAMYEELKNKFEPENNENV